MKFNVKEGEIRKYHLGLLSDDARMRGIEQKQLVDDKFAEELSVAENELIEDYLDNNLSKEDEERFRNFFLITPERRQQVRLTENFRRYAAERARQPVKETAKPTSIFSFLFSPLPVAAIASVIVIVFLGWILVSQRSETDVVRAYLNEAVRVGRPFEARVSGLDYSPYDLTRGGNKSQTEQRELDAANIVILAWPSEKPEHLHNLGQVLLLSEETDEAIARLEQAASMVPTQAEIWNDLGVAYLQKGKTATEFNSKARESFEKALSLNSDFAPARFNLSLALEQMNALDEAKRSWEEYLKLDPATRWANEARHKLQSLSK